MNKYLKELDEKIEQLKKTREELIKGDLGAMITAGIQGSGSTPQQGITSAVGGMFGKDDKDLSEHKDYDMKYWKEHEGKHKKEKKEEKEAIEDTMDRHNEDKHGEAKSKDSAKSKVKKNVNMAYGDQKMVKFAKNGQWYMGKADIIIDAKPDGKYDVPVKEVYDGDDKFKEVGGKGVEGDKGRTIKVSEKEEK